MVAQKRGLRTFFGIRKSCMFEVDDVELYVAYDKCIEEFKRRVESICACQSDAEKAKKESEAWLEEMASYYLI